MKSIILLLVAALFAQCAFAQTPADTLRKQRYTHSYDIYYIANIEFAM